MKRRAVLLIVFLAAMSTVCSSVRTNHDYDPDVDFSGWQTFAWYPVSAAVAGPRAENPLLHRRIEDAINRTLNELGFRRVLEGEPDFYVNYHLSTEQKIDVRTINRSYVGGPHGRQWGGRGWTGVGWTETRVDQFEEGTLIIDFLDMSSRELAWRGSGTRRLASNPRSDQVTQRVNEAVSEILGQFPPGQ